MKKIILIAMAAAFPVASMAAATSACSGTAGSGTAITGVTDGSKFVRVTFTPQCSANTLVRFDQDATGLWGGAGSTKGKNAFMGSTNGGAVRPFATNCGDNGCDSGEVDAAVTAAAATTGTGTGTGTGGNP